METNTTLAAPAAIPKDPLRPATKGSSGTIPQIRKAKSVAAAARRGDRTAVGSPYSSRTMIRTQRSRSAVIDAAALSTKSVWMPMRRRISRTSSRFAVGKVLDVAAFHRFGMPKLVALSAGGEIVSRSHGEAVRDEACAAENRNYPRREARPGNARYDRESADHSVDSAVDNVPQIALARFRGQRSRIASAVCSCSTRGVVASLLILNEWVCMAMATWGWSCGE